MLQHHLVIIVIRFSSPLDLRKDNLSYNFILNRLPDLYEDPSSFKPERFINGRGEFVPDERVMYFGTGKRRCVGEILARPQMYLFAAALLQAFLRADGKRPDHLSYRSGLNQHIQKLRVQTVPKY